MRKYFQNWDAARFFRLALALGLGVYGIVEKDYFMLPLVLWLLAMVIFNFSCCGSGGCASTGKNDKQVYKDIIKPYKK